MPPTVARSPTTDRVRVLIVVGSLDVGGVEMDILRNVPHLDRDRFDVRVYAFLAPGTLAPELVRQGVPLILPRRARNAARQASAAAPLPAGRLRRLVRQGAQLAAAAPPLAWYIARQRIAIVHCFLPYAYIVGGFAAAAVPGCRLVMSRVSSHYYMEQYPHYRFAETRLLHRRVDAVVCNAAGIRAELIDEGVPEQRITIIPNGIDAAMFAATPARRSASRRALGLGCDQFVLTAVANLHPYKGHADLLDALALAAARLPGDWQLLCAGRDVDGRRTALEAQARRLGIGGHVRFLGNVDDIAGLLAASDIQVHPSLEDALPNSLLEAMAAGLPIVATRVGGIAELVIDGEGGLLVPPGKPAAFAAALVEVSGNPNLAKGMASANRHRAATRFSLAASVRRYEDLYLRLMASSPGRVAG